MKQTTGTTPEPEASEKESAIRSVLGLFVVPLLVVLLCVGVFVGFGWIAYDERDTSDYLNDLRSWWRPRRAQAAYELSKILTTDPQALDDDPVARAELRRLFLEAEDEEIRRYLALVLGHTNDPEAFPLLVESLDSTDAQTRIYALFALGSSGDQRSLEPLVGALTDADAGIRKTAAYALGELGNGGAEPGLTGALQDTVADVRWNAALALSRMGSKAGVPVLERMLDRRLTSQVPGIRPDQQADAMISAIRALSVVDGARSLALFERLAKEDDDLKVRQAAIDAKKTVNAQKTADTSVGA